MKQEQKDIVTFAIALLVLVIFLQTCGVKSGLRDTEDVVIRQIEAVHTRLDSLDQMISTLPTATDLEVEGLRSEHRMIQSTDRKKMDLERQNVIEERIEALTKNK